MPQQHFFQSFFNQGNTPEALKTPEYILHNEAVLEILNNWPFVCWLMDRYRHGEIKQIDPMEQLWYNFITSKNIDITIYKNKEEFEQAFWMKVPEN